MKINPSAGITSAKAAAWSCHISSKAVFGSVRLFATSTTAMCVAIARTNNAKRVAPAAIASRDQSAPRPPQRYTSPCSAVMNNRSNTILTASMPEVTAGALVLGVVGKDYTKRIAVARRISDCKHRF